MSKFQDEVGEWGEKTFTQATDKSIMAHLEREIAELEHDVHINSVSPIRDAYVGFVGKEAADCCILLLHLCHRNGIDLEAVAKEKFEINKARKWGKPDAEGVCEHIEEAA